MKSIKFICILVLSLTCNFGFGQKFKPLFNGKDLKGWTVVLKSTGINNDTARVFTVENKLLHISGSDIGYIVTDDTYSNFHLAVEFKWGVKKYPPRENRARDNGILYYVTEEDKIWPNCVECQVQEGDCGDIWLLDSVTAMVDGARTKPGPFMRFIKKKDGEKPTGEWNRIEVIAKDGKTTHIVNGVIVNEASEISKRSGKIAIQTELAETIYRKIEIRKL